MQTEIKSYMISQIDDLEPRECPCGFTRRAFLSPDNRVASLHVVDISTDSQVHYHKKMTEIYLVLQGEGQMELDGNIVPIRPYTSVLIKPGCRHRAVGTLKVAVIPIPAFDENDEWFD